MSNEVVIDPKLLAGLGRQHPTVPPEHRPWQSGEAGIVKRSNPPKQFHAEIPLKVPGS